MAVSDAAAHAAWPPGADPAALRRDVARAHEEFVATGRLRTPLRAVVRDSWRRSHAHGVDPETPLTGGALAAGELRGYRREHLLAPLMPVIRRLLVDTAQQDGQLVAVGDADGRLLWVEGARGLAARAERIGFVEGADWAEGSAGTNAPGTALALGGPVQIYASEHFSRPVHAWSCAAAPLRDPDTGDVLGVVDLTGGDHVAGPHALALVRATVAAAEAELRLLRLEGRLPRPAGGPERAGGPGAARAADALRLRVLGRDRAVVGLPAGSVGLPAGPLELSPRHSEIVLLLAGHPRGLSAEALALLLREERAEPAGARARLVTVRAELSRLRRLLGPRLLTSRPYRLRVPVVSDADEVRRLLREGDCRRALEAYPGPPLPRSTAPGVVDAREELAGELRAVLLRHGGPELLGEWLERPENHDDLELLQAAVDALPPGSARGAMLRARLRRALW